MWFVRAAAIAMARGRGGGASSSGGRLCTKKTCSSQGRPHPVHRGNHYNVPILRQNTSANVDPVSTLEEDEEREEAEAEARANGPRTQEELMLLERLGLRAPVYPTRDEVTQPLIPISSTDEAPRASLQHELALQPYALPIASTSRLSPVASTSRAPPAPPLHPSNHQSLMDPLLRDIDRHDQSVSIPVQVRILRARCCLCCSIASIGHPRESKPY